MNHEEAQKGKLKTKILALMTESNGEKWQRNDEEIEKIKDVEKQNTTNFRIENDVILTTEGKIWIPYNKRSQFIIETHKLLCHAGF